MLSYLSHNFLIISPDMEIMKSSKDLRHLISSSKEKILQSLEIAFLKENGEEKKQKEKDSPEREVNPRKKILKHLFISKLLLKNKYFIY